MSKNIYAGLTEAEVVGFNKKDSQEPQEKPKQKPKQEEIDQPVQLEQFPGWELDEE